MKAWEDLGNDELITGAAIRCWLRLYSPKTMPRNRFEQILRFLHFQNNENLLNHPLKKIKTIIDDLNTKFANFLQPGRKVSRMEREIAFQAVSTVEEKSLWIKNFRNSGLPEWFRIGFYSLYRGRHRL